LRWTIATFVTYERGYVTLPLPLWQYEFTIMEPQILTRDQHPISRKDIAPEALRVLYHLNENGFKGYLAGGCVRDLLLGRKPKDFDVATDATPEEVKQIFFNCRLIGRRFRLAHVHFRGGTIIEVATFRAGSVEAEEPSVHLQQDGAGQILRDNMYGTPEQDALRRDFTVNAMYYNIADFSIIDYARALPDIETRTLRCIGDPDVRYSEDPVRMIRAIRFAATLDLSMESETWGAIVRNRERIVMASKPRLNEDMMKLFYCGAAKKAVDLMRESGLLRVLFPQWGAWLDEEASDEDVAHTHAALALFDRWKAHDHKPAPCLVYALLFAPYHSYLAAPMIADGVREPMALHDAVALHHSALVQRIQIPKNVMFDIQHMLVAQARLARPGEAAAAKLGRRPWFKDALVFYKFTVAQKGGDRTALDWWEAWLRENPTSQPERGPRRRSRPRRRRRDGDRVQVDSGEE